jgi:hypothetical protein
VISHALPGTAQTVLPARFANADTTLLRDTLDLSFEGLFQLADSLHATPDTMRALSIRYNYPLARLAFLADSMHVPVDSLGAVIERERYNPLNVGAQFTNEFRYTSTYSVGQNNDGWLNGSDYNLVYGALFLRNVTSVSLANYRSTNSTTKRQTRSSSTELGWRLSPNLSIGGRANLSRFANLDRSIYGVTDNSNEFQLSIRARQPTRGGLSSEFNFFTGLLDQSKSNGDKRGYSGDLSGKIVYTRGQWLSNDFDGQLTGNFAHTRPPGFPTELGTHDFSSNLRGTLSLFESAPIGLNAGYTFRDSRVETPVTSPTPGIQPVLTSQRAMNVTLRMRRDNDHYINVAEAFDDSHNSTAGGAGTVTTGALVFNRTRGLQVDGHSILIGLTLDATFSNGTTTTNSPRTTADVPPVGYREELVQHSRALDATLSRNITRNLTARLNGDVTLDSYDYGVDKTGVDVTSPRDQYHQSWRAEGQYTGPRSFNTGLTFEVSRDLFLNIASASTSSNSENRSYRAEWRWSMLLLQGLTVTQRNSVTASYDYFNATVGQNRLSMDYGTVTTLNAVLTPRLTLDVNHNGRYQPRGNYTRNPDNGLEYFSPADESRNYLLNARISYSPTRALSLNLAPEVSEFNRNARTPDGTTPQNQQRTLNFSGGASLNFPVGRNGRLTGNINRSYNGQRTTTWAQGQPTSGVRSEIDFWNGSLQFSWHP